MVEILAEAGVNHNGRLDLALALVDAAADAGADVVKFQTFTATALASKSAPKAGYQTETTEAAQSQLDMLKALELDADAHRAVIAHCAERKIGFLSTPFDMQSLRLLTDDLAVQRLKVGSGDMTNAPLLLAAARSGLPIILSTGMATLDEIAEALGVIAYGYRERTRVPSRADFRAAWEAPGTRDALAAHVVILHCTTAYPTPPASINLRMMDHLAETFGLPVGFSDHSDGVAIPIAAVGRGAVMIEKHLTLDRHMSGPDHRASLEPADFALMVRGIRDAEMALGSASKAPSALELKNVPAARKSLVAAVAIAAGERFSADNITVKRPGTGIAPAALWELTGRVAQRDYAEDDVIDLSETM